jgi:hypothetical protein
MAAAWMLGVAEVSSNVLSPRDAALKAVGRTVVNFQRLEHNLKLAARLGSSHGTLPKIQRDFERRTERATTLTLGQAIHAWLGLGQGESPEASHTPDLFDATMQVTFAWGSDAESQTAHGVALKSLLETRNNLIHGGLVEVQWDSPAECERLVRRLDEVNESIAAQLEFVTSILRALSSIRPEDLEAAYREAEARLGVNVHGASDA